MKKEILRLENISQEKEGIKVFENLNLRISKGDIMGILFLSNDWRDYLIELISKNIPINYGRVYFDEILVNNYNHKSESGNKVSIIDKKSRLVDDLTVIDNIFVLRRGFKKYIINKKMLNNQLGIFTEELNINIDGNKLAKRLSGFERLIVELLKAVTSGIKLIIIEDISNCISGNELKKFQNLIKYYSDHGFSFIYICNHHEEAYGICDKIYLIKSGKILKRLNKDEFTEYKIKPYIMDLNKIKIYEPEKKQEEGILRIRNMKTKNIRDLNLNFKTGECTILLDLENNILKDLIKIMNKEVKPLEGEILFQGENYFNTKENSIKEGIAFIDEDPIESMIFKEMSYIDNIAFLVDKKRNKISLSRRIRKSIEKEYKALIGEDIFCKDISKLSSESLYNLIYYRIHICNPKIVFCIQPFYGADMYLRSHIIKLINELKNKGITVIILSVNLSDSLIVADNLIILEEGKVIKKYKREEFIHINRVNV